MIANFLKLGSINILFLNDILFKQIQYTCVDQYATQKHEEKNEIYFHISHFRGDIYPIVEVSTLTNLCVYFIFIQCPITS